MRKLTAAAALASLLAAPALAAPPSYLGAWRITSAVTAPWADPAHPPDAHERARLIGKTVTLSSRAIAGPQPFACQSPHYAMKSYSADMLFEGQFGEMQSAHPKVRPLALARQLGFKGSAFETLETGCDIDWHFVDPNTAEIGLDDWVFTLKKP
jgi:hypothetical protein